MNAEREKLELKALGQKQTYVLQKTMSALGHKRTCAAYPLRTKSGHLQTWSLHCPLWPKVRTGESKHFPLITAKDANTGSISIESSSVWAELFARDNCEPSQQECVVALAQQGRSHGWHGG